MPGYALRDLDCTMCRKRFTLLYGDLIIPSTIICDDCLREAWELSGDALTAYISERLKENASRAGERAELSDKDRAFVVRIAGHIDWCKTRWASADAAIQERERERRAMG